MTPIDIATLSSSLLALGLAVGAMLRKKNHVHDDLRKQLDQALAENKRLHDELVEERVRSKALEAKVTSETLDTHAARAVAYAEQLGGTGAEKLRHALGASIRADKDANGVQDWSDAQHRIAIEAALARRKNAGQ